MKRVRLSYLFLPKRAGYYLRIRGWKTTPDGALEIDDAGEPVPLDTKEKIPDRVFVEADPPAKADRRTTRGDQLAARYAAGEEARRNGDLPARRDVMRLVEIAALWQRKNVTVLDPETIKRAAKWQRALVRTKLISAGGSAYTLNDLALSEIDVGHLEDFRDARLLACRTCTVPRDEHIRKEGRHAFCGVSPRTVFNEVGHVRDLINFARLRERETGVVSTRLVQLPEIKNRGGIYPKLKPTVEQHFAIRDATAHLSDPTRYADIIDFAFNTGLRKHALSGFDLAWFDGETRSISIPGEHMKGGRALVVPISAWAAAILERRAAGRAGGLAWPNPETGVEQVDFSRAERTLTTLAKLPRKFSLHGIRGAFNSVLINHRCERHRAAVPFHVREILMGHKLDEQVEAYSCFEEAVLREAVAVFDCVLEAYLRDRGNVVTFRRA